MTADKTHLDPRARRTLEALQVALATHMRTQQLSEITVSEICRTAGVHRTTFYKHFESVADLAALSVAELVDAITSGRGLPAEGPIGPSVASSGAGESAGADAAPQPAPSFAQWAEALARHVGARRDTFYSIFGHKGDPGLQRALADDVAAAVRRAIDAAGAEEEQLGLGREATAQVIGNAVFGGVLAVVAGEGEPDAVCGAVLAALPEQWRRVAEADWSAVPSAPGARA